MLDERQGRDLKDCTITQSGDGSTFDLTEHLSDLTIAESSDAMNEAKIESEFPLPSDLSLMTSDQSVLSETQVTEKTLEPSKRSSLHKVLTDKVKSWLGFNLSTSSEATSACSRTSQQTVHTDDEGFKVIETRLAPCDLNESFASCMSTQSTLKDWKESDACKEASDDHQRSDESFSAMDNNALRHALEELGGQPGPITIATRKIYINQLKRLQTADPWEKPESSDGKLSSRSQFWK